MMNEFTDLTTLLKSWHLSGVDIHRCDKYSRAQKLEKLRKLTATAVYQNLPAVSTSGRLTAVLLRRLRWDEWVSGSGIVRTNLLLFPLHSG
jgi:hypothetical protein